MWASSDTNMFAGLLRFSPTFLNLYQGATAPVLIMWLLIPAIRRDQRMLIIWGSTLFAISVQAFVSGGDHTSSHLLPFSVLMTLQSGIAATTFLRQARHWRSWRVIPLIVLLTCIVVGTFGVVQQATAAPLHKDLTAAIQELATPGKTRILSAIQIDGLPLDPKVSEDTYQRHKRLAQKYKVYIPPMAKDRGASNPALRAGYYVQPFPWVMGRLERFKADEVKVVKLYSWPIQPEEWQLKYWLDQGFSFFVTSNEAEFLRSEVPEYKQFHTQIREQCKLHKDFQPKKPLFWETNVRLYQCANS